MRNTEVENLIRAADGLNEIVEGDRAERWACKGLRFKDTREWTTFYLALVRLRERSRRKPAKPRVLPDAPELPMKGDAA